MMYAMSASFRSFRLFSDMQVGGAKSDHSSSTLSCLRRDSRLLRTAGIAERVENRKEGLGKRKEERKKGKSAITYAIRHDRGKISNGVSHGRDQGRKYIVGDAGASLRLAVVAP